MKKILTLVLFAILAAVLIGYGIVSAVKSRNNSPTIDASVESYTFSENPTYGTQAATTDYYNSETLSSSTAAETAATSAAQAVGNKITDYAYAYAGFTPAYANMNVSDWRMILVNRDYILPDDYKVKLAPSITDDEDSCPLDYRVAPHYNEMYLAALKDGVELTPISGYRSVERQTNNFERKIQTYMDQGYGKVEATQMAAKIILPPGTSEHNAGGNV